MTGLGQGVEMEIQPSRRRFTVDQSHTMMAAGVFTEDDRLELVKGEIVEMFPIGTPHATCVWKLNYLLNASPRNLLIDIQNPLRLSDASEVYPDLMVLKYQANMYADRIPNAQDALLVIEVSDSTLLYDRTVKLPRYAAAGVAEVWIVDLNAERVLVHRDPLDGVYGQVAEVKKDGTLSVAAREGLELNLADIL
ncbi:Uma2 family endonuclease [soil metagenome]